MWICMKNIVLAAALAAILLSGCMSSRTSLNDGWTADGAPVNLPHCWHIEDGTEGESG